MATAEEKWDAYQQAVEKNVANHKASKAIDDDAFLKLLDTIIKQTENGLIKEPGNE